MPLTKKHGLYETNKIVYIPIEDIMPNPSQPRKCFEKDSLGELASSIAMYGVLQPLTVHRKCRNSFELVSGERRLRAAVIAGLDRVPCLILDVDEGESSCLALVENLHRRDLDFIEEAEGLSRLIEQCSLSQDEAARRVGKSQSAVANKLRLLKLPGEILYSVREAGLTERHARALLRLQSNDSRILALEQIIKKELNVAKTEELVDALVKKEKNQEELRESSRSVYVLKDIRLFLNSVTKGVSLMEQSGIHAEYGRDDTETDIILTIKIPKTAQA